MCKRILIVIPYEDVEKRLKVKRKVIYPIEPGIVISLLKEAIFEVAGIDLNLISGSEKMMRLLDAKIKDFSPEAILIMSQHLTFLIKEQHNVILKIIEQIKKAGNNIKIIVSGPFASAYPEKFFESGLVPDIVFRGEIEDKIVDIIKNINDSTKLEQIPGVCFKKDGNTVISKKLNYIEDLSSLPIADRTVFPLEEYFNYPEIGNLRYPEKSRRFTQITATRGCNVGCSFCKVKFLRGKHRWRDIEHIVKEINYLVKEKGIEEIHFLDENLNLDKHKTKQLLKKIITEKICFQWFCGGGLAVYSLDKELLSLMKKSGCYRLHLAIESGSQRILSEVMKKPVDLKKTIGIIEYARQLDFEIIGYFMIGLPGETKEEILRTVNFARKDIFDYVVFSIYTPEKGTELYDFCIRNRLMDTKIPSSELAKRAQSNLVSQAFDMNLLNDIRNTTWKEINFKDNKKKEKIRKMFGSIENG